MASNSTDVLTTSSTGAPKSSAVINVTPDYEALASEVVLLMAQMRPPHRPPYGPVGVSPTNAPNAPLRPPFCPPPFPGACAPDGTRSRTTDNCDTSNPAGFPTPGPPIVPPDLMEIGRGSVGVLGALSHLGGQATPGKLGQITGLSKGRVSNIIRALEEKGYVEKHPSPTDSRSVTVALSAKGHEVTDQHISAMRAHVAKMLELLGPQDAEDGVRVMRHLAQILRSKCGDAPQEAAR